MSVIKKLFLNDAFILWLILLNSIIIFSSGYFINENIRAFLSFADNLITALFIVELSLKLKVNGFSKYFSNGWNKLDFTLVFLSLPVFIAFVLKIDVVDFSFLLVIRVLRVFKTIRFFKFIPEIEGLIVGIQRALKTSVFVFIGFFVYIFIVGILSFNLFSHSFYFSDPLVSLYSTFKIFTIEGWFEIPEHVTLDFGKIESFLTYVYFIFVVLSGGIFGLSLVNSIFVDSMVSDNNDQLEKKIDDLDSKLVEILKKLDIDETRKNT